MAQGACDIDGRISSFCHHEEIQITAIADLEPIQRR